MPSKLEVFNKAMEHLTKVANDYKKDADSEAGEKAKLEKARDVLADAAIERDE